MGIRGGGDRSELRPLRPDGNIDHDTSDRVVGNHKGQFSGFNIVNPRPGTVHQHGTRRDLLAAKQRGWWIADPEVDGRMASEVLSDYVSDTPTAIDTSGSLYPEYIHLVTSEENFRRLMEERLEENRRQLGPAGLGYLEGVTQEEYATGRSERGHVPTRFATRDHGTFVMEGDRVVESLVPGGIIREEDF